SRFAFNEWQFAKILIADEENIESEVQTLPPSKHQIFEPGSAVLITTRNLSVENRTVDANILADRVSQALEPVEDIPIPSNELAFAILDMCQRPKAIDLQLE